MGDPVSDAIAKGFGSGCGCLMSGAVGVLLLIVFLLGGCGAFLNSLFQ
jgi:hypothetical protein